MNNRRISFAHIINPVRVSDKSDLYVAQPVTFASMNIARMSSVQICDVECYSAEFPEDRGLTPEFFHITPELDRSVWDCGVSADAKKLPLLKDILDRLYDSSDAEYFIYTNVDIAVMPFFYTAITTMINSGIDGMVINRRTISDTYTRPEHLPLMYAQAGTAHYGYDCFVFRRDQYKKYFLAETCIGAVAIGSILLLNVACYAEQFREFQGLHLSFHLGNSEEWRNPPANEVNLFNRKNYATVKEKLASRFDVERIPEVGQKSLQKYFASLKQTE